MNTNNYFFSGKAEQEQTLTDLKKQLKLHENRASEYFKKFAKLQGDYHNLIGISAELVDSLEKCVRGQMVRILLTFLFYHNCVIVIILLNYIDYSRILTKYLSKIVWSDSRPKC